MARFLVTLSSDLYPTNSEASGALTDAGLDIIKTFSFGNTFEVEGEAAALDSVAGILLSESSDKLVDHTLHTDNSHLYYLVDINPETETYNPAYTGTNQTVYLVDTGVKATHPEFATSSIINLYSNYTDVPEVSDFDDHVGHGTAVASLIVGGNQGAAPNATLMNVKLFDSSTGEISIGEIIDALNSVLVHHNANDNTKVKVVCLPWTIPQNDFVDAKISEMDSNNLLVICAAGNDSVDVNTRSPAGVDKVITVGSFNRDMQVTVFTNTPWDGSDGITGFTNFGAELDIFSLGSDIVAANLVDDYYTVAGTSFSAALAAAVATHYIEKYPSNTSNSIKDIMLTEGHLPGQRTLIFNESDPNVDYSAIYKSVVTTENTGDTSLTALPSGRLFNVQAGSSSSINVGLNTNAVNVVSLDFAPPPPWITFDASTGEVVADTSGLDTSLLPGVFSFAIRGDVGDDVLVEEFSIGVYQNDESELTENGDSSSYYYDADTGAYDQVVNYQVAPKF